LISYFTTKTHTLNLKVGEVLARRWPLELYQALGAGLQPEGTAQFPAAAQPFCCPLLLLLGCPIGFGISIGIGIGIGISISDGIFAVEQPQLGPLACPWE
jgi:hypothetical protein